ncbi:MAG: hypothetical protein J1E34_07420 [Oscillospiraceae bacterium]|nr:hypothetical protein [Oscillospiraceae bacterium]
MNDEIKSYVNSFIPQSLSKSKKKELYDELMCHLLDRSDRYEEIGYSKEDSMKKAIDDFGTDETVKGAISAEFERLYHEKTWWALIPAAIILLMNASCLLFDNWIYSADFYEKPTPIKAFISFIMIFVCIGLIYFARVKSYKKMLLGTAAANILVAASLIMVFYPQAAMFTIENNIYYLIDKFTPYVTSNHDPFWYGAAVTGFLVLSAVYCVIAAILIKKDRAHKIKNPHRKAIVLGVCYSAAAVISCILLPKAMDFSRNYPTWFDYRIYSSEESETLYDTIELYSPYSEAAKKLKTEGWIEISDYENSLDKNTRKKFRAEYNELNYGEEYKVWFRPEEDRYLRHGNKFVFLKADESGAVIFKGVGNLNPLEQDEYGSFRFSDYSRTDDMEALTADFESLKKGDSKSEIMARFGVDYGCIYSHFEGDENGKHIERFAIHAHNDYTYDDEIVFKDYYDYRYIELTFTNGLLTDGRMISEKWVGAEEYMEDITIN